MSSSSYALRAEGIVRRVPSDARPQHVVVLGQASKTAARYIDRIECDVVLEEPVHPTVLMLLVRQATHRGKERRTRARMAMNCAVKFKHGLRSYPATLVDLSHMGCKLASPYAVEVGAKISVLLPGDLTGAKRLKINGRITSGHDAGFRDSSEHAMSVIFCELTPPMRNLLALVMREHGLVHTGRIGG